VPIIPARREAFAAPPVESVISNGRPTVFFIFHTPSKGLAVRAAKPGHPKKAGRCNGRRSCFPHLRTSLEVKPCIKLAAPAPNYHAQSPRSRPILILSSI
jgi:hypothetical protein